MGQTESCTQREKYSRCFYQGLRKLFCNGLRLGGPVGHMVSVTELCFFFSSDNALIM